MKNSILKIVPAIFIFLINSVAFAQEKPKDSLQLKYKFKPNQYGSLILKNPAQNVVKYDKLLDKYVIRKRLGKYSLSVPVYMSPKDYAAYRLNQDMAAYFKEKNSAAEGRKKGSENSRKDLLPKLYVNSSFFQTVFGGNTIKFEPTGDVRLKLGLMYQNTEDPQLSERNRSNLSFDFDQQISASINATVGKRLRVTANYDTKATFSFENLIKLEFMPPSELGALRGLANDARNSYNSLKDNLKNPMAALKNKVNPKSILKNPNLYTEDAIIQGIDAGNISMPIKNSLINGAQSLFGVKTNLKFGNTKITAVLSRQNSQSNVITSKAGSSIKEFELRASDYDQNRHFFLSHYFRNNYKNALQNYPLINSPINITRIEVWITNKNASTDNFRNIVAFADIGESNPSDLVDENLSVSSTIAKVFGQNLPYNDANSIGTNLLASSNSAIRDASSAVVALKSKGMKQGKDYSMLQNARKLSPNEYTFHPQLGYISLDRKLNDGEVLAVAYEYTVVGADNGETTFKVGELSNDGIQAPANLAVKLLRSEIVTTKRVQSGVVKAFPTWALMMKNIYALGTNDLSNNQFRIELLYRDDATGVLQNTLQNASNSTLRNKTVLNLLNLDKIDQSQYAIEGGDGFFDYVEGVTINSKKGYIIFPEPEPFGKHLEQVLTSDQNDVDKYVFEDLYLNTKINAKNNFQNKDKFFLKGYYKTDNSDGISIGYNVPRGSVNVTAGGRRLVEGVDYVVDYQMGKVQIMDPSLEASGVPIQISKENNTLFNQQRKSFVGLDVEHRFSDDFVMGATVLNVNETPITPKVNFGSEPINNTMLGLNLNYATEVPLLTKLANKLPFVDTEVPSNIAVMADMAYLLPSTPSQIDINGAATSYIDDFEASQTPISLLSPQDWYMSSTPEDAANSFNGENLDLSYNFKRAKLAWYAIDQIFYGLGNTPTNIDAKEQSRDEVRQINYEELFPARQLDVTQNSIIRTLDLAYFPTERGPYNFNTSDVDAEGKFRNPQNNWAGITRPLLSTNNFDQANVEYIQFWIKDPYDNYSITQKEGLPTNIDPQNPINQVGDLYINLGNISEDVLKDNRKQFENGLPKDGVYNSINSDITPWSVIPKNSSILYAFDSDETARENQDIGFDGVKNDQERTFYQQIFANSGYSIDVNKLNQQDISGDNFQYYRGSELDSEKASIISRYKHFNNTEGNSPTASQSKESYPTSSTSYPDVEDINKDQTMNTVESYYQYKVSLDKNSLAVGAGKYIVDQKETRVTLKDGSTRTTKWYQFRVPVRSGTPINGISDFNSIRFMRMYLTGFKMPVVLRFGQLELVRGNWRRYTKTLNEQIVPPQNLTPEDIGDFEVGVVNIEQNNGRYVLPPGIQREQLQGTTTLQEQNEQSVSIKVHNLQPNQARAIYKNISFDLRMFKNLKMFIHAEGTLQNTVSDNDLLGIIRLGTDLDDNYYQIEVPLKMSPKGSLSPKDVWPEMNNLDAVIETLAKVKLERDAAIFANTQGVQMNTLYPQNTSNTFKVRVKGNPTSAKLRTLMLGVKNVSNTNKSAELWFNELRAAGFNNQGGWAAVVNANANLADVANMSVSGRVQTIGFGNVEDRVSQRSLDETKQYDINTNIQLDKLLTPKDWGFQIPMSFSYGEEFVDPKYDPQYQDVLLKDAKEFNPNSDNSQSYTRRKSINFMNVRKNKGPNNKSKSKFYDVENLSVSYAFNEEYHRDYNIKKALNQDVKASASYNYSPNVKPIEPFKKIKFLDSKYLQLIKDFNFNLVPTTIGVNSRITRSYNEQQSRNLIEIAGLSQQPILKQRRFLFDWDYTIGFNLTRSLTVNLRATNSYIHDSRGEDKDVEIFDNFFNTGRPNMYNHKLNVTYKLPLDKIPSLNFISANANYTADYDWRASSQTKEISETIGNTIQNANTKTLTTNFNLESLYKKIGLEKLLFEKKKRKKSKNKKEDKPRLEFKVAKKKGVAKKKKKSLGLQIAKGIYDVVTMVKDVKVNYSENNGTSLPGYKGSTGFLGQYRGGPTLGFAFGSQVDIRQKAFEQGWLVNPRNSSEAYFNKLYTNTHYKKIDYTATLKPFKDFTIDVRANNIRAKNTSQQLDIIAGQNGIANTPILETGQFSTSYFMMSTIFSDGDKVFNTFRKNRFDISKRLAASKGLTSAQTSLKNPDGTYKGFGLNSPDVVMPAFLSAYSGVSSNKVGLGLFRNIPIPNWNIRYTGLMKFKWFREHFDNISISHGYKSSYSIANYTNNPQYKTISGSEPTQDYSVNAPKIDINGNYQPRYLVGAVSLVDEFSPLISMDLKLKNALSFRGEIKTSRTLTLNLNNSTLTDISGTEYVFGFGYKIKDVSFRGNLIGKSVLYKGDINLRADLSYRNDISLIRSIDQFNTQITAGQKLFSLKFIADYRLNSNLTASFYYNHNTSRYAISTTFPRQGINAGLDIRYNLGR